MIKLFLHVALAITVFIIIYSYFGEPSTYFAFLDVNASAGDYLYAFALDLLWIVIVGGISGVWIGLFLDQYSGASIFIKHFILRTLLLFNGKTPWNYARFLNYTTDCILLQKIGGGYVFGHRLLLEHFSRIYNERV